ncbi:MAG: 5-carboxymethyl-2-hydroxymuconate Delta-isomerase [Bacteroidota bacterium]
MPHFVIDCSENVLALQSPEIIMTTVYDKAMASGLFAEGDVKVRINPFAHFKLGEGKDSFIHVFANIMEGRTTDRKKQLSDGIVKSLKAILPDVPIISMNVRDFEKASYSNRSLVD